MFFGAKGALNSSHFPSTHWKTDYSLKGKLVRFLLAAPRRCWQELLVWWPCAGITAHVESLLCPIFLCWPLRHWSLLSHTQLLILPLLSVRIRYSLFNTVQPIYRVAELCCCLVTTCHPLSSPFEPSHPGMPSVLIFEALLSSLFPKATTHPYTQTTVSFTLFSHFPPNTSILSKCLHPQSPCITFLSLSPYNPSCYLTYRNL